MATTIKQHAHWIAAQVAQHGHNAKREAYSHVVANNSLTLGELGALRNEIDVAIAERLQAHEKAISELAAKCQEHDPETGYFKAITPYKVLEIIRSNGV